MKTFMLLFVLLSLSNFEESHSATFLTTTPSVTSTTTPTPSADLLPDSDEQSAVVDFEKDLYSDLGHGHSLSSTVEKFKPRYSLLNTLIGGGLQHSLLSLAEMRLIDLQASVRHARRLRKAVELFSQG